MVVCPYPSYSGKRRDPGGTGHRRRPYRTHSSSQSSSSWLDGLIVIGRFRSEGPRSQNRFSHRAWRPAVRTVASLGRRANRTWVRQGGARRRCVRRMLCAVAGKWTCPNRGNPGAPPGCEQAGAVIRTTKRRTGRQRSGGNISHPPVTVGRCERGRRPSRSSSNGRWPYSGPTRLRNPVAHAPPQGWIVRPLTHR